MTLWSVYTPTLQTDEETALNFYEDFRTAMVSMPNDDKLTLMILV